MRVDNDDIYERRSGSRNPPNPETYDIIRTTVRETLLSLGLDMSDPIQIQKDFQHLRDWREASESIKKKGILTLVTVIATGGASLLWVALKSFIENLPHT